MKAHLLATLKQIALMGGTEGYVSLSSKELGQAMGISQQSASQRILDLLDAECITRDLAARRQRIRLQPRGLDLLRKEYADYQRIFEGREGLRIRGTVTSGLGEGAFYMRQEGYKKQFRRRLWFTPYEGTLNLLLESGEQAKLKILADEPGVAIDAFEAAGRTFGAAKCFFARIEDVDAAVILPVRTHHTNQLEIISQHYLRGRLGLEDGDVVAVDVSL